MFKTLRMIACVSLVGVSLSVLADGQGYNCTFNPPTKYVGPDNIGDAAWFGSSDWGQCYLDSAVIECQNNEMMDPPAGCDVAKIESQIQLVKNHSMASIGCSKESSKGWLPAGVTESQCETDLLEFSKNCTGNPVSCSG